jgi:hypothetical protein
VFHPRFAILLCRGLLKGFSDLDSYNEEATELFFLHFSTFCHKNSNIKFYSLQKNIHLVNLHVNECMVQGNSEE